MLKLYREGREEFDKHYHQRSRVESVYSAMKKGIQQPPNIKKRRSQRNKPHLKGHQPQHQNSQQHIHKGDGEAAFSATAVV